MNTRGFKRFAGLDKVVYCETSPKSHPFSEVQTPADRVMDLIFSRDSNGWPNSSVEVMLSEKTSDEVRNFITNNLLKVRDEVHLIDDPKVINEFQKLSSDFIAKTSRNRYESIEDYEKRLSGILDDYNKEETFKSFHERLRKLDLEPK